MEFEKRKKIIELAEIIAGSILYALAIQLFLLPVELATGGATGIAIAVHGFTDLSVSSVLFVVNALALVCGLIFLGKKFIMTTLLSTVITPAALSVFEKILGDLVLTRDIWLCTVFSGLTVGLTVGIVLRAGASTGGSDIFAMMMQKYLGIPLGLSFWILDSVILFMQGMIYSPEVILYGFLVVMISSVTIDKTLTFGSNRVEVKIVSKKSDEIRRIILRDIDRGVTMLRAVTGYTSKDTQVILSAISNRELPKLQKLVHEADPDCFMIISHISEVQGNGFTIHKNEKYQGEELRTESGSVDGCAEELQG